jgi:hypothetical protein
MKRRVKAHQTRQGHPLTETNEMLVLPDGRVLVHNLTPAMARLLHTLNPDDPQIAPRSAVESEHATRPPHELPD